MSIDSELAELERQSLIDPEDCAISRRFHWLQDRSRADLRFFGRRSEEWKRELREPGNGLEIAEAFLEIGRASVPWLIEALSEDDEELRLKVVGVLATLGRHALDAVPKLEALYD